MITQFVKLVFGSGLLLAMLLMVGCSVEPVPIEYGSDACHFCKMNIVDRQYAAEFVTKKGKVYKFDAIECMVQQLNTWDKNEVELFLVTDHEQPSVLTDAKTCTYLISAKMPSPMGADLTAFASKEKAESVRFEIQGETFAWNELLLKFEVP